MMKCPVLMNTWWQLMNDFYPNNWLRILRQAAIRWSRLFKHQTIILWRVSMLLYFADMMKSCYNHKQSSLIYLHTCLDILLGTCLHIWQGAAFVTIDSDWHFCTSSAAQFLVTFWHFSTGTFTHFSTGVDTASFLHVLSLIMRHLFLGTVKHDFFGILIHFFTDFCTGSCEHFCSGTLTQFSHLGMKEFVHSLTYLVAKMVVQRLSYTVWQLSV